MAHKLEVLAEVAAIPEVKEIRIFSGLVKDAVRRALLGEYEGGTVLRLAPGRLQEVR
jgi:isopentenyl phosphate kinase